MMTSSNFPRYWKFVRGIHRPPVNSPHKGQWRGALMFSLISAWINGWVNNGEAGDLRCRHAHYDVVVMTNKETNGVPPMNLKLCPILVYLKDARDSFYQHGLSLISAWIRNNHTPCKLCAENIYPFPNLNAAVEFWEWRSNFISHFIMDVISYPCRN